MPVVPFDLRGLAPGQGPSRRHVASVVDAVTGPDAVVAVRGPVQALAAVLARLWKTDRLPDVPVAWEPVDDADCRGLARDLQLGTGTTRELSLVRDDHGGVLLHHGRIEAAGEPRRALARRFGAQAHHDDARVADGSITRIEVRPRWDAVDSLSVAVLTVPLRRPGRTTGRALQVACDPARVVRDGVPLERDVVRWTWYADDRVRWRLQP
ncbi:hypothetical protein [Modestobacter sp. Leaf380]|uniref:hypothetical protein n=1 Tax=Modestobacter sp. Leaf380 TaxID=1736356 RepID=UPI0006F47F0E|nr:hypothetical protein [Modestobacter sp. Leaf380]KQS63883.1 hypothetical protein ASG41_17185 [Modestobacter sp. Leaf380]